MSIKIRPKDADKGRKYQVEVDSDQLERIAAAFGWFGKDFQASLDRAEKDYESGKYREISSLEDLKKNFL